MRPRSVKVFAPATVANLGSGFDVLGLAIEKPGDEVTAQRMRKPGLHFSVHSQHADIPHDPKKNVAAHVAQLILDELKPPFGVRMVLHKKMPIGSGLGSSAASSVAAAVAINALLPKPLKKHALLRFAVEGERIASGSPHADNAAPSLLGGVCLVRSYHPLDVLKIPIKNILIWVVVHPNIVIRTEEARNILPKAVPLHTAIRQWGNIAGLTIGLAAGNISLVGKCVHDEIVEPVRGNLIPGFHEVKQAALKAGAYGCSISGSGPSLFAVAQSRQSARTIAKAMTRTFSRVAGTTCDVFISRVNMVGATLLWVR